MAGTADRLTPRPARRAPASGMVGIASLSAIATGASAVLIGLGTSQLNLPQVTTSPWVSSAGGQIVPAAPPVAGSAIPNQPTTPGGRRTVLPGVVVVTPPGSAPGTGIPGLPPPGGGGPLPPPPNVPGIPPVGQEPSQRVPSGQWPQPPEDDGWGIHLSVLGIEIDIDLGLFSAPATDERETADRQSERVTGPLPYPVALPSNACDAPKEPFGPAPRRTPGPTGLLGVPQPSVSPTGAGLPTELPTAPSYVGRHRQPTEGRHRAPASPSATPSYGTAPTPSGGSWTPAPSEPSTPPPSSSEPSPSTPSDSWRTEPAPAPSDTPTQSPSPSESGS